MNLASNLVDLNKNLKGRSFISLHDFSVEEIRYILDFAHYLKIKQKRGEPYQILKGKTLGMIFTKNSTRTRVSFEVGMYQLGGLGIFFLLRTYKSEEVNPLRIQLRFYLGIWMEL